MRRSVSFTFAALMAVVGLAACGGSSKPSANGAAARQATMVALAKCMRSHGVPNFPDPSGSSAGIQVTRSASGQMTVNGVSVNAPAFQAASAKCRSVLPSPPPISATQLASIRSGALKMAQCMRAHGVPNFPDPVITAGPGGRGIAAKSGAPGADFNSNSPAFAKASQACGAKQGFAVRIGATGKQSISAKSTVSAAS
jgi:hypothetical protein